MLKINHIKVRFIHIILWAFLCVLSACYIPRGAFLIKEDLIDYDSKGKAKIVLPIEFQAYSYFRITYVKNMEIYIGAKINDSTIVFLPKKLVKRVGEKHVRVEAAIIPFSEKE